MKTYLIKGESSTTHQLVQCRIGRRAEVDFTIHHDGRGVDGTDLQVRALGGESPLLDKLAGVVLVDRRLARIVPRAGDVAVIGRPILRIVLAQVRSQ